MVNDGIWRIRAPAVAREALEAYFGSHVVAAPGPGLRTAKAAAPELVI